MSPTHDQSDGALGISCAPDVSETVQERFRVASHTVPTQTPRGEIAKLVPDLPDVSLARLALCTYVVWLTRYLLRNVQANYSLRPTIDPGSFQPYLEEADAIYEVVPAKSIEPVDESLRGAVDLLQGTMLSALRDDPRTTTDAEPIARRAREKAETEACVSALTCVLQANPPDSFLRLSAASSKAELLRRLDRPDEALSILEQLDEPCEAEGLSDTSPRTRVNFLFSLRINRCCAHIDRREFDLAAKWLEQAATVASDRNFDSRLFVFWEINSVILHVLSSEHVGDDRARVIFQDLYFRNPGFLSHCTNRLRDKMEPDSICRHRLSALTDSLGIARTV